MTTRKYNFNPGPATLPFESLQEAQKELLDYHGAGMSILEISHRSKEFEAILAETKSLMRKIMGIPDTYEILFLGGGASLQFTMVPMNFLTKDKKADYIITGSWSKKAHKEAKLFGQANVAATTEVDGKFRRIPKQSELKLDPGAEYVHLTSNNTIFGTQFQTFPNIGTKPLFADMSSDILSRRVDVTKFGMIYAGAQKNLGPAGVTVIILRKDLVSKIGANIPTLLDYRTHIEKDSLYNTPPVFPIYIMKLVLKWVDKQGGVDAVEKINNQKAEILYGSIDKYKDFYRSTVDTDSRSKMNVTFRLPSEELEKEFIDKGAANNFHGLKGHRSVGGIRVSMYNALPLEGIQKLTEFMKKFKESH
ncbi:MAG: phosphoserine transaminase [Candidatus Schekmanbacteria bacterium RBG_13_48_7]|uniref:Phosphoserine aminotransferase n=1 Tax=Candidatus Schekmanbacteria bacterium RBG_13_48_7 TaxID=1817878 RepID=A0A1F7RWI0_9BACT|nr:MAG: phosphoserine transaminase [Candidatus Schekmanbacteria bacterium RBG_13_48_7]